MTTPKHTPGPWGYQKCPKPQAHSDCRDHAWLVIWNDGKYEGDLAIVQTEQAEANARLIAAAPELLEACRELLDLTSDLHEPDGSPDPEVERINRAARAAIAKAEGDEG